MTFNNEQKQAEFDAFKTFCEIFAKRKQDSIKSSGRNQLSSFTAGQYGGDAQQEIKKVLNAGNVPKLQSKEIKLGKPSGGGSSRRSQSPGQPTAPKPGSPRDLRLKERAEREGRLAVPVVVAGGETAESLIEGTKRASKIIRQAGATADELLQVQLSTGAIFDTETGQTERLVFADAADLSAKELVEKYRRDLIYEYLFNAGESAENLDQKTDRQLANILKRKVSEA